MHKLIHFRQLLAIAALTVRSASRSRVFQYVLALVALTVIGLPVIIRGDGTIDGYARISLDYSLKLLTFVLAATSVWAAVAVSSREIEEKQIHLLVTKPVAHTTIWLGKWFGLLIMNGALLLFAGICVCAVLRWHLRPSKLAPDQRQIASEEVFTARRVLMPDQSELRKAILKRADELAVTINTGLVTKAYLLDNALRDVLQRENTIQPGASKRWVFNTEERQAGKPLFVRFILSSPQQLELKPVAVQWRVFRADDEAGTIYTTNVFAGRPNAFCSSPPGDNAIIVAEFVNIQTNPPATVIFSRDRGVTIMIQAGSFEGNLIRALIMILCELAVLSALGLTMGCIFSMPVAVFAACAVLAAFNLSGVLTTSDIAPIHDINKRTYVETITIAKFKMASILFAPIRRYNPVDKVQRSEFISWSMVGEAIAVEALLYSGLFCFLGVFVLKRRQLGMPQA
ncbi:MAG: hypothetical protein WCN95_05380 [bacterium]